MAVYTGRICRAHAEILPHHEDRILACASWQACWRELR